MKTREEVEQLFEQVRHLIESDEPIDHPWEVRPHQFTESQLACLLGVFPNDIGEQASDAFLQRMALAVGAYHRLSQSGDTRLSNSEARASLEALRKAAAQTKSRFEGLPAQLHSEIDLALQHVLQSKQAALGGEPEPYVRSFTAPYSDATTEWVRMFVTQLQDIEAALVLIEERRRSDRGGKPVDRAMSYLSLETAKAYRECFVEDPTPTEGKSFERILANLAQIVGRNDDASDLNVMHYVQKAIKDLRTIK